MKKIIAVVLLGLAIFAGGVLAQTTPQFTCSSPSGFGVELERDNFYLDLQCQPLLARTLEIQPGASARFTVSLSNYYAANAASEAHFNIHLAMDRARIVVRQADQLNGELLTDTFAALQNVAVVTTGPSYTFVVENRGLRSAVLDLSVRPNT